ncbi:ADP-ribosylglycohydrolase [Aureliella helgolandensis]|uniref:ADP-ribosylglycohydrolase n=1 Tax=Aureliella helgolandensis TaxID=2527968 RepID=A0A518G7H4_9BACT|nr:ADP-ribosylglycohydrolase [Aureliella helgolandensis]
MNKVLKREAIVGCILGTAVGDALGLPYEGLTPQRAPRLLGLPGRYRFLLGRGMISDDTEHTCMVAQSLMRLVGACMLQRHTRFKRRSATSKTTGARWNNRMIVSAETSTAKKRLT